MKWAEEGSGQGGIAGHLVDDGVDDFFVFAELVKEVAVDRATWVRAASWRRRRMDLVWWSGMGLMIFPDDGCIAGLSGSS